MQKGQNNISVHGKGKQPEEDRKELQLLRMKKIMEYDQKLMAQTETLKEEQTKPFYLKKLVFVSK